MPIVFTTEPITCPECCKIIELESTGDDPFFELERGEHKAYSGIVDGLDDVEIFFVGVRTCCPVRIMTTGQRPEDDSTSKVTPDGFEWCFRWDR